MLVTFPQMGNLENLLSDLLERLQVDYMPPPRTTNKTLALGTKYAPEFSCLPLKINIGNFVEAMEAGADTLLTAGGRGPCRFGYYAEVQRRILSEAGYEFDMAVVEPPAMGLSKFFGPIKKISGLSARRIWRVFKDGFPKARAFDEVERKVLQTRCYEVTPGDTTKALRQAFAVLRQAGKPDEIAAKREEALAIIDAVEVDKDRQVLKVGLVGEFFIMLEPFANFDIEEWLGNRGVYVERSVYCSDWINPVRKNLICGTTDEQVATAARPYLRHTVGGEGLPSVGHGAIYAKEGFDGIIHMFPFTCMPDTIAKAILPNVGRDFDIPIIHFTIDEQTGKAGVTTRLEAFTDLMVSRRKRRLGAAAVGGPRN